MICKQTYGMEVNFMQLIFLKFLLFIIERKNRNIYDEYRELVNTTHPRRIKNKKTHVASYEKLLSRYTKIFVIMGLKKIHILNLGWEGKIKVI